MSRLNYALVPERPSDAPIYRKGWRSIKRPYAKPPAGIGTAAVLATRRGLHEDVKPRSRAHNFEIPAWNIDFPDPARGHREISTDAPKARSVCGGWRLAFPSLVLESTPGDAAAAATPNDGIPFNTAPFGVQAILSYDPGFCVRKAEKARARNDPAESVNATPFADSWKVEESRLLAPIRRTIMTVNTSSSKVKLEDVSLLKKSGKGTGTRRSSQRYSFRQLMESGRVTLACAHPPHYHDSEHGLVLKSEAGRHVST